MQQKPSLPARKPPTLALRKQQNAEIAAISARLLAHYWPADEPAAARQAQIEDWVEDLAEFRLATVEEACREWRRAETRRPLPGDIRRLCIESISRDPAPAGPDRAALADRAARRRAEQDDMQREGREIINRWAQANGFADLDAMAEARGVHWSVLYCEQMSQTLAGSPIARALPTLGEAARKSGIIATEYNPTAAAMAAGRAEIGLPEPPATDDAP